MINQHYTDITEIVDFRYLKFILEEAKNMKTDILIIPRIPFQSSIASKILGVSDNSIVCIGDFDSIRKSIYTGKPLWNEPSLQYISLWTKDISPFLKIINDKAESIARESLKIKNPKEKTPKEAIVQNLPSTAIISYKKYMINNVEKSIAYKITVLDEKNEVMVNVLGNNSVVRSDINLIDYTFNLNNIFNYTTMVNSGQVVCRDIDISDNKEFNEIINSKAGIGARIWYLDKQYIDYMIYLNKAFLNVSKGDRVYCSIIDNINNKNYNYFMVEFTIVKLKKKFKLDTILAAMKFYRR